MIPSHQPVCTVRNCGTPVISDGDMCHDCAGETEAMMRYLRARDAYRRELAKGPSLGSRLADAWDLFRTVVWPRISHAAVGLVLILLTFGVLIIGCAVANG